MEPARMTTPRIVTARVGERTARVEVRGDGEVAVSPEGAAAAPAAAQLTYLGHGRFRVAHEGWTTLAYAVEDGDRRWVFVDGETAVVDFERGTRARSRGSGSGDGTLAAPMPATVVRVLVAPGQVVTRGAALILLEAMKMELPLRAPADGIVESVACADGDLVQPGVPLVRLRAGAE
jgi:3-methylcrotonyl-CoA carboxylase alpha subunit